MPGHEGVGVISEKGSGMTSFNVGDLSKLATSGRSVTRARIAYQVTLYFLQLFCSMEGNIAQGRINTACTDSAMVRMTLTRVVWSAGAIVLIWESYASAHAATVMCGGATARTVLTKYNIRREQRVGVIRVDGMGHLAVKLSAALGYNTVVFSRSNSKRDDCMALGAKGFHILS